ncbi:hypothetical protein ABH922_002121 [Rhodococcus sp. 27YEA15]|uniref:DoxX family protein n=1 Tax=Rhodococcus sp. 27YEA15 TaxID=3156259 RepID=UPI003C7C6040
MVALTRTISDPRVFALFAAFQAGDAVISVKPIDYVARCLDSVHFPQRNRWIFPVIKAASAVGLAVAPKFPGLARVTAIMLTLYFAAAVGAHVRAKDLGFNAAAATSLLVSYAALALVGTHTSTSVATTVTGATPR